MYRKRAPKGARFVPWEGERCNGLNGAMSIRPKRSGGEAPAPRFAREHALRAALRHLEEAISFNRRASQFDPKHATPLVVMGYHFTALGRYPEAEFVLNQAARLNPVDEHAHYYLGLGKLFRGSPQEAIAHFEDSAYVFRLTGLAIAYHQLGDRRKSDQALKTLRERYGHILPYQLAEVYAFRGESDLAFQWLDRSCQLHDASIMYLLWDPLLFNLHSDPRFTTVLQRVHLPLTLHPPTPPLGTSASRHSSPDGQPTMIKG